SVIDLDGALDRLESMDPRMARVVELKYFGGLTNPEIAEVLSISAATVDRDAPDRGIKVLRRELDRGTEPG
ncbi:MAG: RNA polymerase subunit sigma-70, partial [Blastocatellia bacterium]|nr:RNA polymerase subunit sigma-70 [Blastocatellia bacterium]